MRNGHRGAYNMVVSCGPPYEKDALPQQAVSSERRLQGAVDSISSIMHDGSTASRADGSSRLVSARFAAIVAFGVEAVRNCDLAIARLAGLGLLISTAMMATLFGLVWLVWRVW
jgi:hypothetical protein